MGHETVASFCRAYNLSQVMVGKYENFRDYPKKDFVIERLERVFRCPIEDLFPNEYKKAVDKRYGRPIEKIFNVKRLPALHECRLLPSPEDEYEKKELKAKLVNSLKTLTEKEEKVLKMRYFEDLTLREVANMLRLSVERIRQIESKAIRKLKHPSRSRELKSFLYGEEADERATENASAEPTEEIIDVPAEINVVPDRVKSPSEIVLREDVPPPYTKGGATVTPNDVLRYIVKNRRPTGIPESEIIEKTLITPSGLELIYGYLYYCNVYAKTINHEDFYFSIGEWKDHEHYLARPSMQVFKEPL